jgi:hypothetical protein
MELTTVRAETFVAQRHETMTLQEEKDLLGEMEEKLRFGGGGGHDEVLKQAELPRHDRHSQLWQAYV